jgi:hypothetical protein
MQNAENAFSSSRLIEPPSDNALYWAREARRQGNPQGAQMEERVLSMLMAQVNSERVVHNYDAAIAHVSRVSELFPDRSDVAQIKNSIVSEGAAYAREQEAQRKQAEVAAQTKQFRFNHRHIIMGPDLKAYTFYCTGLFVITPDGTVRYDCTGTNDPQGRCDHVSFPAGTLKGIKLNNDGSLHLASKSSGNYDFYGDSMSVRQAVSTIAPFVSK